MVSPAWVRPASGQAKLVLQTSGTPCRGALFSVEPPVVVARSGLDHRLMCWQAFGFTETPGSLFCECLLEVGFDILEVLKPDGDANLVFGDSRRGLFLIGELLVRG